MTPKIPVSAAQALAETTGQCQVVIIARSLDGITTIVTWGDTTMRSEQAAQAGNKLKAALDWPAELAAESPKVAALEKELAELKAKLEDLKPQPQVFVLEGTEYERGWGQRPDGYVLFKDEEAADEYLRKIDQERRDAQFVPDEYTSYDKRGWHTCSKNILDQVHKKGLVHIHQLKMINQ